MRMTCSWWGASVLLAGLTIAGGCGVPAGAQRRIQEAQTAAAAGQFHRAADLVEPVIRAHGNKKQAAAAFYVRGQCRVEAGQRDAARQDFQTALRQSSDADLRALVAVQLGNLAFDDGAYPAACEHYAGAVERLPHRPPADRVFLQYGIALQRSGRFDDANRMYAWLIKEFPNSPHVAAAQAKQAWAAPYFAIQCGAFGQQTAARDLAGALRASGLDAEIANEVRNRGRLFVVRVGRFPSYTDAARALGRVRGVVSDAYIVP